MTAGDKILVLGHGGLLGSALVSLCEPDCRVVAGGRDSFDLARLGRSLAPAAAISGGAGGAKTAGQDDLAQRLLADHQPDAVINCAAFTQVDQAEQRAKEAWEVNVLGVEALARACARAGVHLVHLSTDYVFDGRSDRPYREDDQPNPLSVYGKSKLAGEARVLEALPSALVVRTAWLFGPGKKNFVAWLLDRAEKGLEVPVVTDQLGSPTYSRDLARALLGLVRERAGGLLHLVNRGQATRLELALAALAAAGLDQGLLRPMKTKDLGLAAARPSFSVMDTGLYESAGRDKLPHWRDALARHLAKEEI